MNGQLFTQAFLRDGIKTTPVWEALPDSELDAFAARLRAIYSPFDAGSTLNEASTEQEIILKVLGALGWDELWIPQNVASTAIACSRYPLPTSPR